MITTKLNLRVWTSHRTISSKNVGAKNYPAVRILALLGLFTVSTMTAQAETFSHSFGFSPSRLRITQGGGHGFGGQGYPEDPDIVSYEGAWLDSDPSRLGHPALPILTYRFILPPLTKITDLSVNVRSTESIAGTYWPIPIQPPEGQGDPVEPLPGIYQSQQAYPEQPVQITVDGYMHGFHLATIHVWPVQYIGYYGELRVIRDLAVSIEARDLSFAEGAQVFRPLREDSRPWHLRPEVNWIERNVLNPWDLERLYMPPDPTQLFAPLSVREENPFGGFVPTEFPSLDGPPVDMVIVTDDVTIGGGDVTGLTDVFEDWAEWKTKKGVPTVVRTVSWIDSSYVEDDRPQKIRAFVKDAAKYWGTDYLLLGGDVDIVPARFLGGPNSSTYSYRLLRADPPGDMYFGELDGAWNLDGDAYYADDSNDIAANELVDIWVARLPVRDSLEAAQVIAKLATYELRPDHYQSTPDTAYYNDILLAAGPTNSWCAGPSYYASNGVLVAEAIADSLDASWFNMQITRMYPRLPDISRQCGQLGMVRCFGTMIDSVVGGQPDTALTVEHLVQLLDAGQGYVFHAEHSTRDKLGLLSDWAVDYAFNGCDSCPDGSWVTQCRTALKNYLQANYPSWKGDFLKGHADGLANGPEYSVVVSLGSYSNQHDLDGIGEHLLRNPDGGAIAYFGRISSYYSHLDLRPPRHLFGQVFKDKIFNAGMAAGLAANYDDYPTLAGIHWRLLGDPETPLWTQAPESLVVTVTPDTLTSLGAQSITVEVQDDQATGIEGVRVCLQQADVAYAVAWTLLDGKAYFPSFATADTARISVVVTCPNFKPQSTTIPFNVAMMGHEVVYSHHYRDDNITGGDGDDVFEAGENVEIEIVAQNLCSGSLSSVEGAWAHLWPNAPILFDLDIYGRYDARAIYIGAEEAHPPAVADTFRLPGNWHAIRPEGIPVPSDTSLSSIVIWRETDGKWGLISLPGDDEGGEGNPAFEGTLVAEGGFESVVWDTSGGGDWVEFDENEPDTLRFKFYLGDPADQDTVWFRAEAADWIDVLTDSVGMGTIQCGDTASAVFELTTGESMPDWGYLPFTLAVRDTISNWWFSDLFEEIHTPGCEFLAQRKTRTNDSGNLTRPWRLRIWPSIANLGSAVADSVYLVVEKTAGTPLLVEDTVETSDLDPGEILETVGCFVFWDTDSSAFDGLEYDLMIHTIHPNDAVSVDTLSSLEICSPDCPSDLLVDEASGAVILKWSAADSADVVGYHVHRYNQDSTTRLTLAPVAEALRYEVDGLDALEDSLTYYDYRYGVTAVDESGNESPMVASDTARVWLPEAHEWPKRIPGLVECAPKVFDLDGDGDLEIIAAGQAIYAWHHDGTPVLPGNADGLLYDPPGNSDEGAFMCALAVADIDFDDRIEIAANYAPDSLLVIEYNSASGGSVNREFVRSVLSSLSAPMIADLDSLNGMEIAIPGDDKYIHVWDKNGDTFRNSGSTDGRFLTTADEEEFNYRSLAVAELVSAKTGLELVHSLRTGKVVVYPTDVHDPDSFWESTERGNRYSTPLIGDFDGDSEPEVVVTRKKKESDGTGAPYGGAVTSRGAVFVICGADGAEEDSISAGGLGFRFVGEVPAAAALADFDGDDDLDIVVGGGRWGRNSTWASILRAHFIFDSASGLDTVSVDDDIPIPGRKFFQTGTTSQPVVADLDGDEKLEVLMPTNSAYLACLEWDPSSGGSAHPERGWPQLFDDVPLTPTIADVDGAGNLEMVVTDRAGWVHLFELPGLAANADLPWPEYGHDPRNTFDASSERGIWERGRPLPSGDALAGRRGFLARPNPVGQAVTWILFAVQKNEAVELSIFDVQGRQVRSLLKGELTPGTFRIRWDGLDDHGSRVGSGIYFMNLEVNGRRVTRKLSVVR